MRQGNEHTYFMRDVAIVIFSLVAAFVMGQQQIIERLLDRTESFFLLGSFLAGLFFVSIFTVAPSVVMIAQLAESHHIVLIAIFGGVGSVIGDFLIFKFVRDSISEDVAYLISRVGRRRVFVFFERRTFKWLLPFLGALVVASPLPDEVGLTLMGLSRIKSRHFIPISFSLNFLGILIIGLIAKGL